MTAKVKIETTYDPVIKRYRGTCPVCGYVAVRAKREAAQHAAEQHATYAHDGRS